MTNLDSVLKTRDITLLIKVHLVKGMIFPVVMYRRESWTLKKTESQRIDAFELSSRQAPWGNLDSEVRGTRPSSGHPGTDP